MFRTVKKHSQLVERFEPITLVELNERASMLTRLNKKYLVPLWQLPSIFSELKDRTQVLEIGDHRVFHYESCYFDFDNYATYYAHHQNRRKRFKVRTRRYVETDLCYLEVKLKSTRGRTVKTRCPVKPDEINNLSGQSEYFIKEACQVFDNGEFSPQLYPSLSMNFRRITLVAKDSAERVTFDFGLNYTDETQNLALPEQLVIIEAKSYSGRGVVDRMLREKHIHPVRRMSKYCIGLNLLGKVEKGNRFLPVLRRIENLLASHGYSESIDRFSEEAPQSVRCRLQLLGAEKDQKASVA